MNALASVEAAVAALVALWLAAGLLAHPAALGSVALLALLPLALVALPALAVRAFGGRPATVRRSPSVRRVAASGPSHPERGVPSDD